MLIRRALFVASTFVMVSAAPAFAQTYNTIPPNTTPPLTAPPGVPPPGNLPGVIVPPNIPVVEQSEGVRQFEAETETSTEGSGLARTGQDNVVPLVQGSIVLLGSGMLLLLMGRRRRSARNAASA